MTTNNTPILKRLSMLLLGASLMVLPSAVRGDDIGVSGYLTGTINWYRTNIYTLNGMVFVRAGGVLNIESGTVIKGHNIASDSTNISALVICRDAKINAQGTRKHPIIF